MIKAGQYRLLYVCLIINLKPFLQKGEEMMLKRYIRIDTQNVFLLQLVANKFQLFLKKLNFYAKKGVIRLCNRVFRKSNADCGN